jgi:type IV secretory pathway VirB2 component (pilin)
MYYRYLLTLYVAVIFLTLPDAAYALPVATDTVIGNMMCNVTGWMFGTTGKGIATLSVIMLGILALFNKISWGMGILHIVGIALIEGAAVVVNSLNAGGTGCA